MCFWGEGITKVQSEGVAVNPPLKNLLLELNVARQGLMDYSTHTKSIIFFKYILQKAILCYGYIYSKRLTKTKCLYKIYIYIQLSKQFERSLCQTSPAAPTSPCQWFLAVPQIAQERLYQAKHNFGFLGFDFLRKCGIFDDLILLESLKAERSHKFISTAAQSGSTNYTHESAFIRKCKQKIQHLMKIENTTPHAATLQPLLGWKDQTVWMFSLWGEAVEQLGPAWPPLEGSRTRWGTALRSLPCLLLRAEVGTGNLQRSFPTHQDRE